MNRFGKSIFNRFQWIHRLPIIIQCSQLEYYVKHLLLKKKQRNKTTKCNAYSGWNGRLRNLWAQEKNNIVFMQCTMKSELFVDLWTHFFVFQTNVFFYKWMSDYGFQKRERKRETEKKRLYTVCSVIALCRYYSLSTFIKVFFFL